MEKKQKIKTVKIMEKKQKINRTRTRIIRNVARNLTRLFVAIVCHFASKFHCRAKWIARDITAFLRGQGSYAKMMQAKLDHNHRLYREMDMHPDGFFKGGRVHSWDEAVRY